MRMCKNSLIGFAANAIYFEPWWELVFSIVWQIDEKHIVLFLTIFSIIWIFPVT